tara:strand:- start:105 stop:1691 length:1587 start_codon:yes stop_codon:yes gene_type:complete
LQENSRKFILIHPILIAFFPVFLVYYQNIHLLHLQGLIFPTLIILSVAISLWYGIKIILKNTIKSALLSSLYTFLFFSYGHVFIIIESNLTQEFLVSIHVILLISYTIFIVLGTYYIVKTNRKLNDVTKIANVMSITALAFIILNIGIYNFENTYNNFQEENSNPIILGNDFTKTPDVYYIILDEYAPLKTLENFYDYDNSDFIKFLEEKGFYVPKNSHSNYAQTSTSLASSLNMKYLNYLSDIVGNESKDHGILYQMLDNNLVMRIFKSAGYQVYNISSGAWNTGNLNIADEHLCSKNENMDFRTLYQLKQTSILRSFDIFIKEPTSRFMHQEHRDRIFCQFDEITEIKQRTEKPVFVFMHILSPHDPFVFGPNGEEVDYKYTFGQDALHTQLPVMVGLAPDEEIKAYRDQVIYLTKILRQTIDKLLENSDNPPIIIIQSDTGPFGSFADMAKEVHHVSRISIFNAYYFPNEKYHLLYDDITPVNSFRIVFDSQFQTNYGLLEDKVFFSTYEKLYAFTEITDVSIGR